MKRATPETERYEFEEALRRGHAERAVYLGQLMAAGFAAATGAGARAMAQLRGAWLVARGKARPRLASR